MHAHPDPRLTIAAALGALVLALTAFMLAAGLGDLDLGFGSGDSRAPAAASAPAGASLAERPLWLQDPLASPLEELRAPVAR